MCYMERKQINLRLSEEFLAQLDEARGLVPREAWIRQALTNYLGWWMHEPPAPKAARSPEPDPAPETPQEPSKAEKLQVARQTLSRAEANRKTGHKEGCGCLNCERAMGKA